MNKLRIFKHYFGLTTSAPSERWLRNAPSVAIEIRLYVCALRFEIVYPDLMSMTLNTRVCFSALPVSWALDVNKIPECSSGWRYQKSISVGQKRNVEDLRRRCQEWEQ